MTNSGKINVSIYQSLLQEFIDLNGRFNYKDIDCVVVLSAEEIQVTGENKQRIQSGLNKVKKNKKNGKLIYLGTKAQNQLLIRYALQNVITANLIFPTNRISTSTKTQIKDLAKYIKKTSINNLLIISHAYHIPRIQRYCKKYIPSENTCHFYRIGKILDKEKQVKLEISKIIKYSEQGDLPLYLEKT